MRRQLTLHDPLAAALASRGVGCEWVMLADSPGQFPRAAARLEALARQGAERLAGA